MKVYWTKDRGAVITSANLSQNALGSGNLREIGVWFEPGQVDIDRILGSLTYRKASTRDLHELDYAHREYYVRNKLGGQEKQAPTFREWHDSAHRAEWRLYYWVPTSIKLARDARVILKQTYGVSHAYDWAGVGSGDDYPENSWLLGFTVAKSGPARFAWMFVDQCVKLRRSDKAAYDPENPYQVVQVWPTKRYPAAPFRIDNGFREAFRRAAKKLGLDKLESWVKPPSTLLKTICRCYR